MGLAADDDCSRYLEKWVRRQKRSGRIRSGTLGRKLFTVSHLAVRQRRIWYLLLCILQRSVQQRNVPPSILDAGSQQRKRRLGWIIGRGIVAVVYGIDDSCRPPRRGSKGGSERKVKVIKRIIPSWHQSLLIHANYTLMLCPLRLHSLSVPCWFLMRTSFLQNPKPKNPKKLS